MIPQSSTGHDAAEQPNAAALLERTAQALRDSERRFRALFETMIQGVVYQNAAGEITDANPAAELILGLSLDQMQGRSSVDPRWHAVREDGSDFPGTEHPAMVALRTGREVRGVVMGVFHPSEQAYRWILVDAVPQCEAGSTHPSGVYATFNDITERRRVEAALQASEARFRRLAEHAPAMIFRYEVQPAHGFSYVNRAAEAITGYVPEEYYADPSLWRRLVHPDDLHLFEGFYRCNGNPDWVTLRVIRADGKVIWLELRGVPLCDENETLIAIEGMAIDITARRQMELDLTDSHARLKLALDAAHAGVWEWRFQNNTAIWSDKNYALLGLSPETAVAAHETWLAAVHPEDRAATVAATLDSIEHQRELNVDFRVLWPDGSVHWLNDRGQLFFDGQGRPERMVGIKVDVTESRVAAEALHNQISFLKSLLAAFPNPVFYKDRTGIYLGCNEAFCAYVGRTQAEVVGHTVEDLYAPELAAVYRRADELVMAQGLQQEYEAQVDHADGSRRDVLFRKAVFRDHTGQVAGLLGIFLDITDRKQTERILAESERKFRDLAEQSPNMILIYGRRGLLYVNSRFVTQTGYSQEELFAPAFDFRQLVAPDAVPALEQTFARFLRGEESAPFELPLVARDGQRLLVWYTTQIIDFAGEPAILGITTDITELKQLEGQLRHAQKMEAIGVLAGGIAHDFNNLLTPIVGYSEMLLESGTADARQQRYLNNVLTAGLRAKRLVRQLLAFSRPQTNEPVPVDLRQSVGEALSLLRPAVPSTIEIMTDFDPACGAVLAEPTQILQVIMNLCTNAYQAIGEATGTIRIGVHALSGLDVQPGSTEDNPPWLRLSVADTGVGMDANTRQRLFEPFFTTKEVGKGTGLGLPVVYGIVQQLGGRIEVASEPGHGSTFTVLLPTTAAQAGEPVPTSTAPHGAGRILVADDEEAVLQVVTALLEDAGYQVTACRSGAEALAAFLPAPDTFSLLITDQVMAGMPGDELVLAVLRLRPELPVLMMTGYSERMTPALAQALGVRRLLEKPFDRNTLLEALEQLSAPLTRMEG